MRSKRARTLAISRHTATYLMDVLQAAPMWAAGDWACRQCHPDSDVLIDGFVCIRHRLVAFLEPTPKRTRRATVRYYCELCDRWFSKGGDCHECGYTLRRHVVERP